MVQDPKNLAVGQEILRRLTLQEAQLDRMENHLRHLRHDLEFWFKQRTAVVDKIEYHFDQLKVEKLEGTLNIGLTPGGLGQIEDLELGQNAKMDADPDMHRGLPKIHESIHRYLQRDVPELILALESEFDCPQDEERRAALIADLARQADPRIQVYLDQADAGSLTGEERVSLIVDKLKSDIRTALEQYFIRWQGKEMNKHEPPCDQ
jgi:spore germination protein PC